MPSATPAGATRADGTGPDRLAQPNPGRMLLAVEAGANVDDVARRTPAMGGVIVTVDAWQGRAYRPFSALLTEIRLSSFRAYAAGDLPPITDKI